MNLLEKIGYSKISSTSKIKKIIPKIKNRTENTFKVNKKILNPHSKGLDKSWYWLFLFLITFPIKRIINIKIIFTIVTTIKTKIKIIV